MAGARRLICSSHTISGVMPGGPVAARHGFDARVRAAAEAGYVGLCLHYRDYLEQRRAGRSDADLRAVLDHHGIAERSVEFSADWFRDDAAEAGLHAAALGLGAASFNVGGDLAGHGLSFADLQRAFGPLCGRAAAAGLAVAFEVCAWGTVTDFDTGLALIDGHPNAGLVVDAWHVFRGGIALDALRRIPAGRILCVQVSDAAAEAEGPLPQDTLRRRLCGAGAFDLAGFAATLDDMGVTVPFSVEIIAPENAARDLDPCARLTFATARAALAPGQAG